MPPKILTDIELLILSFPNCRNAIKYTLILDIDIKYRIVDKPFNWVKLV